MIRTKITNKQVKENYYNIISVGYCDMQFFLRNKVSYYYNSGVYGWNYDVYELSNNTCLVTGYRPINGNIKVDYKIIRKYEEKARSLKYTTYDDLCKKLNKLQEKFINEVLKGDDRNV